MAYNADLQYPYYAFVCTECHSDQQIDPFRNSWVAQGDTPPCKFCSGVVIYVEGQTEDQLNEARRHAIADVDTRRLGRNTET